MNLNTAQISKHYNKLVIVFIVLTLILVLFIGYFAFSKTTITVKAVPQTIAASWQTALDSETGKLFSLEVEGSKEYTDLDGQTTKVEGTAEGKVTLYNDYSADQPLVATTRLMSEDGVLFRIKDDVTVPKGSSIEVEVYADEAGKKGDISPSKFEIVALNEVKKDKIYGQSTSKMSGGEKEIAIVTQTDLANAKEGLIEELKTEAHSELMGQVNAKQNENLTLDADSLAAEVLSEEYNTEAGAEADSVTVNLKIKVVALALNKKGLLDQAATEAEEQMPEDLKLADYYSVDNLSYELEKYDLEKEEATIKVTFTGTAKIYEDSSILDKDNLMGKNAEDLTSYLNDFPEIESTEVNFSPAWVTTVPRLESNIKIIVE